MAISKKSIDDVRERADIVTEIGSRVQLKKAGGNYMGLCPFHGEKSPSFSVSPAKQFFHCFGCGKSGDVIQFLMDHDGMQFHEAVKDLGERLGVRVEEDQDEASIRRAQEARKASATLEDVCESAAGFFQKAFSQSAPARAYAAKRGLSQEVLTLYGVGFAPDPSSRKALAAHFPNYSTSSLLIDAGMVVIDEKRDERRDRFRDRLMFPIRDVRGSCIGFGGRIINDQSPGAPKYLNSPETPIFHKGKVMYGLNEARAHINKQKLAFVTEGYMDVVGMAQHGIGNAVAALGTALTDDHLRLLLRFTDNICFVFDGDRAGQSAAWKSLRVALPMLEAKHRLSYLTLPANQDPDEYLAANGSDSFLTLAKSAPTLSQYLIAGLLSQHGQDGKLVTAEAKAQFLVNAEEMCTLLQHSNPLRGLLLEEVDLHLGRVPRTATKSSLRDRLRSASQAQGPDLGEAKKPWLPRDEWLKQQSSGLNIPTPSSGVAPILNKKSLWVRLCEAAVICPLKATEMAPVIIALLDVEVDEESTLQAILESVEQMQPRTERYAQDQIHAASDLLQGAQFAIKKQRLNEITTELKKMLAAGELSDEEFVEQMSALH